jgi:hypothetical protein
LNFFPRVASHWPSRTYFCERKLPGLVFSRRRGKYSATENTFPLYLDGNPVLNAKPFILRRICTAGDGTPDRQAGAAQCFGGFF